MDGLTSIIAVAENSEYDELHKLSVSRIVMIMILVYLGGIGLKINFQHRNCVKHYV